MPQPVNDTILQDFSRNQGGKLCLHFTDPAYVQAELVIFDRADSCLYAVLHGSTHLIGCVNPDLAGSLRHDDEIILAAPHYHSGTVNLHSKVSVV